MNGCAFVLGIAATLVMALIGWWVFWLYRLLFTDWETGRFVPPNWGPWRDDS